MCVYGLSMMQSMQKSIAHALYFHCRIRKDFSFDDGVAETFGCEVHSFDPL